MRTWSNCGGRSVELRKAAVQGQFCARLKKEIEVHTVTTDFPEELVHAPVMPVAPTFLQVLWRRKTFVAFGLVIGLLVGLFKYIQEPPKYGVTAQLMVLKRRAEPVSATAVGGSSVQVGVIEDYVATQEALIQSHEVLWRAAKRLETGAMLRSPPLGGDFIGHIAMGLKVVRCKDVATGASSNILNISYRGLSAEDGPVIVNAVVEGYREAISGAISSVTDESLKQIEKGRGDAERRLAECQKEYQEVHEKIRSLSPLSGSDLKARINLNEGKRADLLQRKIELDSRLQLVQKGIKDGQNREVLLSILQMTSPDTKTVPTAEDVLLKLKIQEEEMLEYLGAGHPAIINLRKRREMIQEHLRGQTNPDNRKLAGDGLDVHMQVLFLQLEVIKLQSNVLQGLLEDDRAAVAKLDGVTVQEMLLSQECERLRKHVVYYDERKQQADLTRDAPLFDARVITPAGTGTKVSPVLLSTLALAGCIGLILGAGLAYLAEITDKRFQSVHDVSQRLGLTVIGDIPELTAHEPSAIFEKPVDPLLTVHHLPKSSEAEGFRGVRTSIYFSARGKGHQVIQVTSPSPGDGKSTMVSNLATAIAQSGKSVILIDADFRKPRIHKIFGVSADVGLVSVITGETKLESAIQNCQVPGLSILPCGPRPANPADLLTSALFEDVLDEVKKNYDFVLIDTPPLLAVSDPSAVAPRVDGVILVIRLKKNDYPAALQATQRLAILGAKTLGVVVNGTVDQRKHDAYGCNYGYVYRYEAYGDEAEEPKSIC